MVTCSSRKADTAQRTVLNINATAKYEFTGVGSDAASAPTGYTKIGTATVYSYSKAVVFKVDGRKYYVSLSLR